MDAEEGELVPIAFVAVTVKVYAVPFVNPVTTIGEALPLAVKLPGLDVTVYEVIVEPPSEPGALNATEACVFPAVAAPPSGARSVL